MEAPQHVQTLPWTCNGPEETMRDSLVVLDKGGASEAHLLGIRAPKTAREHQFRSWGGIATYWAPWNTCHWVQVVSKEEALLEPLWGIQNPQKQNGGVRLQDP